MDVEIIRRLRLADPYLPFRLTLNDGRQFDVVKPHHLALAQNNARVLIVTGPETAVWFSPAVIRDTTLLSAAASLTMSGGDR